MRIEDYLIDEEDVENTSFDMVEGDTSLQDEPLYDPSTEEAIYGEIVDVYQKTLK